MAIENDILYAVFDEDIAKSPETMVIITFFFFIPYDSRGQELTTICVSIRLFSGFGNVFKNTYSFFYYYFRKMGHFLLPKMLKW